MGDPPRPVGHGAALQPAAHLASPLDSLPRAVIWAADEQLDAHGRDGIHDTPVHLVGDRPPRLSADRPVCEASLLLRALLQGVSASCCLATAMMVANDVLGAATRASPAFGTPLLADIACLVQPLDVAR